MAESEWIDKKFLSSLSAGHSLEALITAPLTAISKANAMMLGGQTQFILEYCFKQNNGSYSPVMIKMEYSKNESEKSYFEIPLITLLPMNNLAVDKVDVSFNVEVTSAVNHVILTDEDENQAKPKLLKKKTKIGAKIASSSKKMKHGNKTEKGIAVSIEAKQIPLARGITTLIDVYSKNIITSQEK